jgi:hypothetical protein
MKRSELKQLITEVIREARDEQLADRISDIINNHAINSVKVLTNHGSYELEIREIWESNGTLYLGVVADKPAELQEDLGATPVAAQATNAPKPGDDRARKELAAQQEKLNKVSTNIKALDANIAKREEAIQKANEKDQLRKQNLTKQQGPIIRKMEQLKKKVGDNTPEQTQDEEI